MRISKNSVHDRYSDRVGARTERGYSKAQLNILEAEAEAYFAKLNNVERKETRAFQCAAIRSFRLATL